MMPFLSSMSSDDCSGLMLVDLSNLTYSLTQALSDHGPGKKIKSRVATQGNTHKEISNN
jgi:hypothetical protein